VPSRQQRRIPTLRHRAQERGSARAFARRFNLAEYIEVESAAFENGLLHVNLVRRMPDKMKPRKIAIGNVAQLNAKGTRKAA
jgi:molecular chaperone IbpA